jgi:prophage DNA circulation protein
MGEAAGTQPIGTESNIITGLADLSWRKLEPPEYDIVGLKGGWDLSRGSFPYVHGASHDNMGRQEIPMSARLMFLNTLSPGSFPDLFNKWFKAVAIDPTPDKLVHPILGEVDARVLDWEVELTAVRTDGVVMLVNWTDTLLDPEKKKKLAGITINIQETAAVVQEQIEELDPPFVWPDGIGDTDLFDMIGQIEGLIETSMLRVQGLINQALGMIQSITDLVDRANEAKNWSLSSNLKKLYVGMLDLQKSAHRFAGRETKIMITQRTMTVGDVAAETDNTVGEIIGLNPVLLSFPQIPKGAMVSHFA